MARSSFVGVRPGVRRIGLSLVELLVVLAVIGTLAAIGVARIATPSASLFANDVKAALEQGRFEAVRRHVPVAVHWNGSAFETRAQTSIAFTFDAATCTTGSLVRRHDARDYRGVGVAGTLLDLADTGLVWLPSGLVVDCAGNPLPAAGATIVITDARTGRTVRIWPGGAVAGS